MRAAIYARYSSDLQRDASIEDQVRLCKERVEHEQLALHATYTDHAMSGASRLRPGYQKLLEDARGGAFDVVIAEALDRLSRDQEDIAGLYKHLTFLGVRIITLSEGEVSELHVGLKGTMNALFLKDLAAKIRRGLRGRIEQCRAGGSKAYGYKVVLELDAKGQPLRGGRCIDETQAPVVRRVFVDYVAGTSPKAIAKALNRDAIPGPMGKAWSASTIYGNWRRGTGILNNDLYVGRLVWNRQHFVKNPQTGRRMGRVNPPKEWIVKEVPALAIIDRDLWARAKARQVQTRQNLEGEGGELTLNSTHRRHFLLSGLLKCGKCGSNYVIISSDRYGCAGHRDRGICNNELTIKRVDIEERVLRGLKERLLAPGMVKEFIKEFVAELNRFRCQHDLQVSQQKREMERVRSKIAAIMSAIEDGIYTPSTKARLLELEQRQKLIADELNKTSPQTIRFHPNLAAIYQAKVAKLQEALDRDGVRSEAAEIIRGLVAEIRLTPDQRAGILLAELTGALASILTFAIAPKGRCPTADAMGQLSMVAEEGFEPPTQGL
jgi:site-specific DNA recombinase